MKARRTQSAAIEQIKLMLNKAIASRSDLNINRLAKLLKRDRTSLAKSLSPDGYLTIDLLLELSAELGFEVYISLSPPYGTSAHNCVLKPRKLSDE